MEAAPPPPSMEAALPPAPVNGANAPIRAVRSSIVGGSFFVGILKRIEALAKPILARKCAASTAGAPHTPSMACAPHYLDWLIPVSVVGCAFAVAGFGVQPLFVHAGGKVSESLDEFVVRGVRHVDYAYAGIRTVVAPSRGEVCPLEPHNPRNRRIARRRLENVAPDCYTKKIISNCAVRTRRNMVSG